MAFKKITIGDFVLLVFFIIISSFILYYAYKNTLFNVESVVVSNRNEEIVYSIHKNQRIDVKGDLGYTHIEINDGEVVITDSPCKEKTCINHPISKTGESLICLPNGVIVELKSVAKTKGDEIEISF